MKYLVLCAVMGAVAGALLGACASAEGTQEVRPRPGVEIAPGGARIRGGGVTMDVQIGRGLTTRAGTAGSLRVTPDAVVTP